MTWARKKPVENPVKGCVVTKNSSAPRTELAYRRVKKDLMSGKLPGGEPLRIETLQTNYQVGTTPLREALARLESEGFVELRHNRGFYATSLSVEDFRDLIYSRKVIERALLERAIERGGNAWEVDVIAAHHLLKKNAPDVAQPDVEQLEEWSKLHVAFHVALLSGAEAPRLLDMYRSNFEHLSRHQMALSILPAINQAQQGAKAARVAEEVLRRGMAIEEHTALMEAALARDIDRALALIESHVQLTPWQQGPQEVAK
jgi:DNA-binding GntR family transcriptional regulator